MNTNIPFNQRFGTGLPDRPIDKDVPDSARIGLLGILDKLRQKTYVESGDALSTEALFVARRRKSEFTAHSDEEVSEMVVKDLSWDKFYILCERVYRLLQPAQHWNGYAEDMEIPGTLEEAQHFYTYEINELLAEENLAYEFAEGMFQRRGRPQTRKSLQRVSAVLADPNFGQSKKHYNKAVDFFNERPNADVENCIKEAVCALEAFVEILFGKNTSKHFDEAIRSKQGNQEGKIPPTIAEGIIKLRAFRGNAKGVAHASISGGAVSETEAELVLSLVASYITYLHDRFPPEVEDFPF